MNDQSTPQGRRTTTADLSWMLWTAIGIGGIWIAVLLISLLAPDMVTGSEQQHLPVAAFATWFWGGIGTLVLLWAMGRLRGNSRVAAHLDRAVSGDAGDLGAGHDPGHHPAGDGHWDRPDADPLCRHLRADRRGDADGAGGRHRQRVPRRTGGRVARPRPWHRPMV